MGVECSEVCVRQESGSRSWERMGEFRELLLLRVFSTLEMCLSFPSCCLKRAICLDLPHKQISPETVTSFLTALTEQFHTIKWPNCAVQ